MFRIDHVNATVHEAIAVSWRHLDCHTHTLTVVNHTQYSTPPTIASAAGAPSNISPSEIYKFKNNFLQKQHKSDLPTLSQQTAQSQML